MPRNYPLVSNPPEEILHSPGRKKRLPPPPHSRPEPEPTFLTTATSTMVAARSPSPPPFASLPPLPSTNDHAPKSGSGAASSRYLWSGSSSSIKDPDGKLKRQDGQEQLRSRAPVGQHSPHPAVMKNLMEPQQNAGRYFNMYIAQCTVGTGTVTNVKGFALGEKGGL